MIFGHHYQVTTEFGELRHQTKLARIAGLPYLCIKLFQSFLLTLSQL